MKPKHWPPVGPNQFDQNLYPHTWGHTAVIEPIKIHSQNQPTRPKSRHLRKTNKIKQRKPRKCQKKCCLCEKFGNNDVVLVSIFPNVFQNHQETGTTNMSNITSTHQPFLDFLHRSCYFFNVFYFFCSGSQTNAQHN